MLYDRSNMSQTKTHENTTQAFNHPQLQTSADRTGENGSDALIMIKSKSVLSLFPLTCLNQFLHL